MNNNVNAVLRCAFQSPSLRGSGRFRQFSSWWRWRAPSFQSPSLRGSGRFGRCRVAAQAAPARFNPLHCGAVVASRRAPVSRRGVRVSIPFIAGQWSLRAKRAQARAQAEVVSIPFIAGQWSLRNAPLAARRGGRGFNPLHCGAVVASRRYSYALPDEDLVSIPFIAGQWSLPVLVAALAAWWARVSIPFIAGQWSLPSGGSASGARSNVSIPFIAGQWSLPHGVADGSAADGSGFNPLHCGAVVASLPPRLGLRHGAGLFQSPSLRGSGRFMAGAADADGSIGFQSPSLRGSGRFRQFSSWWRWRAPSFQSPSLRGSGRFTAGSGTGTDGIAGFNPLHCGAVVASTWRTCRRPRSSCFNPLHCGAVVASEGDSCAPAGASQVSIPFIAGQWSLHDGPGRSLGGDPFQSPSLRGSGRFSRPGRRPPATMWWFQSPSLRGSGRFSGKGCSIC